MLTYFLTSELLIYATSLACSIVIQFSVQDIVSGLTGDLPYLEVGVVLFAITSVGIFLKFALWIWCTLLNRTAQSDMLEALAEDHFNDVLSNTAAIGTVLVAYYTPLWWSDPAGAIVISLVIIMRWVNIMKDQVKKIVGHTAPPEFIAQIEKVATSHDDRIIVDCTRVYYFGARCELLPCVVLNIGLDVLVLCTRVYVYVYVYVQYM
ncbi:hypothetical protein EON65_53845 [archaeon]|nr:MAG: hypothetical protein EON65_53845 [archaeon]